MMMYIRILTTFLPTRQHVTNTLHDNIIQCEENGTKRDDSM